MNKIITAVTCILLVVCLCACGGKESTVKVIDVESDTYSEKDIASAIDVIVKEFGKNWKGCTLKEIRYAGDELCAKEKEYAERFDADEVIVLLSSFDVDSSGGDGSLNPDSTYTDWNWILVRTNGGKWRHVEHGYW